MEVYKVLARDLNGLLSSVSQHHPHTFEPGQVTVSTKAPLFVFTNLGFAKDWSQLRLGSQVWKVEVDYLWDIPRIIHSMDPGLQDADTVLAWWRGEIELKTRPITLHTQITPALKLLAPIAAGDRDSLSLVRSRQAEAGGPQ